MLILPQEKKKLGFWVEGRKGWGESGGTENVGYKPMMLICFSLPALMLQILT